MLRMPRIPSAIAIANKAASAGSKKAADAGAATNFRVKSFLSIFKPLLWLLPLAFAAWLIYLFMPDNTPIWGYNIYLNRYCLIILAVITGLLLIYVIIRLVRYLIESRRAKKQEEQVGKAEMQRLREGFEARWEDAHTFLKSASVGPYDVPWYLMIGGPNMAAQSLLDISALSVPETAETKALGLSPNVLDRWLFANDAIFIDTAGRQNHASGDDAEKIEWEVFLKLMAEKRRRCPINGVVMLISAFDLVNDPQETRIAKAQMMRRHIRYVQTILKVLTPVYFVVMGMERVIGFTDFFYGLSKDEQKQIWGWSNPHLTETVFNIHMFFKAFDELTAQLKRQRMVRLSKDISPEVANRGAMFPDEFASMAEPLSDYINTLFTANRYDAPPVFRGFYFTGGSDPGQLTTQHYKHYLGDNVLEELSRSVEVYTPKTPLFINDLFKNKIFKESGLITRPRAVFRKNLKVKLAGALIVGLFIVIAVIFIRDKTEKSNMEVNKVKADVHAAKIVLQEKKRGGDELTLCRNLSEERQHLTQIGMLDRILGMGRFEALEKELSVIHRSVFQETTLKNIISKTETALNRWHGKRSTGDPAFHLFAAALDEYINWTNDNMGLGLNRTINILPFLEFLQLDREIKHQYDEQFQIYLEEGGRSSRIVSASAKENIRRALEAARIYLRPSLEYLYGPAQELTDAQWWLKLALHLKEIEINYTGLLKLRPPTETSLKSDVTTLYLKFRGYLNQILTECHNIDDMMQAGQYNHVRWIDVHAFYDKLLASSRNMKELERLVAKDRRDVTSNYQERVITPIKRLAPEINMLMEYPSQAWLTDVLVKQFGPDVIGLTPDFGIGSKLYGLVNQAERYNDLIERIQTDFTTWRSQLPLHISSLDGYQAPIESTASGIEKHAVLLRMDELKAMSSKPVQAGNAEEQTENERKKEERRKDIVAFWRINNLDDIMRKWVAVADRVKMHTDTLYFNELFNRADFQQGIPKVNSWPEIKALDIFRKGDGMSLVIPIHNFLQKWLDELPSSLLDLSKETVAIRPYPELREFTNKLKEIIVLKDTFLPKLRANAIDFAECVQLMPADTGMAWQELRDSAWTATTAGNKISWNNLQSFSGFRQSLEMERGEVDQVILRQLVGLESHVLNTFKKDLINLYRVERKQFYDRYNKVNYGLKFPFRLDGPQLDDISLLPFFSDVNTLERHFELEQGMYVQSSDGQKTLIAPIAQGIVKELVDHEWMQFYQNCNSLERLLFKKGMARTHKAATSMKPGAVGSYFHWVRIHLGNGIVKDISVYGKPLEETNVIAEDVSVTLHGLDAARMPQSTAFVTQGDHALLQMIYLYGKPMDAERMIWLVDLEIPLSISPSFTVKFTMRFQFEEGLPELPIWPGLNNVQS
ncbi:type VI secretion protein IcmF/TssM N-terminal domain-containing protein [Desulfococcaceae bacterium HSG9]|nr:type VI secretion protein IcmF/TssM N-terminal domain-containing protein [Desulfococcaceae bacterium HSG9]